MPHCSSLLSGIFSCTDSNLNTNVLILNSGDKHEKAQSIAAVTIPQMFNRQIQFFLSSPSSWSGARPSPGLRWAASGTLPVSSFLRPFRSSQACISHFLYSICESDMILPAWLTRGQHLRRSLDSQELDSNKEVLIYSLV